jgi:hypothetical protein
VERADLDGRRVLLDLGEVRDVARVSVNGKELAPLVWAPFVTDVTGLLRPGHNLLAVRVANTLSNERNKPLPWSARPGHPALQAPRDRRTGPRHCERDSMSAGRRAYGGGEVFVKSCT